MQKQPCTYILASAPNGTLYIGVTSDLIGRMSLHIQNLLPGVHGKVPSSPPRLLRDACNHGSGDRAGKAAQEMEPAVEDPVDRGSQP
jgi:hypothetical protein